MPHVANEQGLKVEQSFSYLLSEIGQANFFVDMFPSLPILLPKTGIADEEQVKAWIDQQLGYSAAGTFFGSITYYTYLMQKAQQ